VLFYHNDALGSPVALTDSAGSVMWRVDYEPFGNLAAIMETLPNTHEFIGKERDPETSLHYFGARYYDDGIGRFLSVDPALYGTGGFLPQDQALSGGMPKFTLRNPQYLNSYAYSLNNPYRYVDPTGKIGVPATLLLVGLATYGVYSAFQTIHDPNASPLEQGLAVTGAVLGMMGPVGKVGDIAATGAIKITEKGLAHILKKHGVESTAAQASKFAKEVDIQELIRKAETVTPTPAKIEDRLQRIVDAGQTIGIDRTTGQATSIYTVITDKLGNLVTAHPGLPSP